MRTRVYHIGQLGLTFLFCLGLASCNQDDFYQKEFLETPTAMPGDESGAGDGSDATDETGFGGTTQGGASGGSTTVGSTTGGTIGGTIGGSTGGADGGSIGGATGGMDGGASGGSTGGVDPIDYTPSLVTENFKQSAEASNKLDILWVIDNSFSMDDEQAALGRNFDSFIRDFIDNGIDFKMAITTTDTSTSSKAGAIVPGSLNLTSSYAQTNPMAFINDFKKMVNVGVNGDGYEKALLASSSFMNRHSSILRPDAYLAVVILSDEEDQSPNSVTSYANHLKSFKKSAGLVKVYSIVDTGLTNRNAGAGVNAGFARYAELSKQTSGTVSNIRENFSKVLGDMGESLINLLDSFALASKPVAGSLKVYVNGALVSNYTYDEASHSIKFDQASLPPVGSDIKITYLK